jgi:hypothetical protein
MRGEAMSYTFKVGDERWTRGGKPCPNARPCNVEWIRDTVRQCKAAGVAVFVKQLGANVVFGDSYDQTVKPTTGKARTTVDPNGGDPSEWPEDLQVREIPR